MKAKYIDENPILKWEANQESRLNTDETWWQWQLHDAAASSLRDYYVKDREELKRLATRIIGQLGYEDEDIDLDKAADILERFVGYEEEVNESIKDVLKPKSEEEIEKLKMKQFKFYIKDIISFFKKHNIPFRITKYEQIFFDKGKTKYALEFWNWNSSLRLFKGRGKTLYFLKNFDRWEVINFLKNLYRINESIGDILKPKSEADIRKYLDEYDVDDKIQAVKEKFYDPEALLLALGEAGADPEILIEGFLKIASEEDLRMIIRDLISTSGGNDVEYIISYVDTDEKINAILKEYFKEENAEEVGDVMDNLLIQHQISIKNKRGYDYYDD